MNQPATRCINLDWLEFYLLESPARYPCDADYYRNHGYQVSERDYGTRQYEQMFTVLGDDGHGFVEIRRKPVSGTMASRVKGIFSPYSCHIKLVNRWCYHEKAMRLFLDFLAKHEYKFQRIFRLDIALDFEKFDSGDKPNDFLKRYMSGVYSKINQGNVSAHGADRWEERKWNSVSWGAPTSMVSTKFYCKSMELASVKDKPYIRYAWLKAGLVDDWLNLTQGKGSELYKPEIWRVEFSIRSSARGWYVIEDNNTQKTRDLQIEHIPSAYDSREKLLQAFSSLCHYYFHFKYFVAGRRKDLCKDKKLFEWGDMKPYRLDKLLSDTPVNKHYQTLIAQLEAYYQSHPTPPIFKAVTTLIDDLQRNRSTHVLTQYSREDTDLLQALIAKRIKENPKLPLSEDVEEVKAMLEVSRNLFKTEE